MGKRSSFARREKDFYPTPVAAVAPLVPHLAFSTYCEPCAGAGDLVAGLNSLTMFADAPKYCVAAYDVEPRATGVARLDASSLEARHLNGAECIVTNPPYLWGMFLPLAERFVSLAPTWLLLPMDWAANRRFSPLLRDCRKIVPVGRVKWIPGSKHSAVDNFCWFFFDAASPARLPEWRFRE